MSFDDIDELVVFPSCIFTEHQQVICLAEFGNQQSVFTTVDEQVDDRSGFGAFVRIQHKNTTFCFRAYLIARKVELQQAVQFPAQSIIAKMTADSDQIEFIIKCYLQ